MNVELLITVTTVSQHDVSTGNCQTPLYAHLWRSLMSEY